MAKKKTSKHPGAKGRGVPVTLRALVQRINRRLLPDGLVLKRSRGSQAFLDLGDYFVLNATENAVLEKCCDPESLGRRLGVLQPWETVIADGA